VSLHALNYFISDLHRSRTAVAPLQRLKILLQVTCCCCSTRTIENLASGSLVISLVGPARPCAKKSAAAAAVAAYELGPWRWRSW